MPCRDYESQPNEDYYRLRDQNDRLARMLCAMCTEYDARGIKMPPDVNMWWEKHKEADARAREAHLKKEKENKIKKEALKKLTAQEAKLLGVDRYGNF